jgi:hypothetical protein
MLKRGWFVFSVLWAAAVLADGSTGISLQDVDWTLAGLPFILALLVPPVFRYIVSGSLLRSIGDATPDRRL